MKIFIALTVFSIFIGCAKTPPISEPSPKPPAAPAKTIKKQPIHTEIPFFDLDDIPTTPVQYKSKAQAVIDAIQKTTFHPATQNERPVRKKIEIKMRFSYKKH